MPTVDAPNGEARVAPGTSFRVGFTFGYAEFGLTPGDLDPLPLPEIVARERESVRRAFSLRSAEAPAGWRVSLADVVRVVEPIGAGSRTYHLEVLVQIDVPADAPTGRHPVIATVRSRNGVERDVSLEVEVTGGEGR